MSHHPFSTIRYAPLTNDTDILQEGDEFDRHGNPEAYRLGWESLGSASWGKRRDFFPDWCIRRPDLSCLCAMPLSDVRLIILDGERERVGRFVRNAALNWLVANAI